MIVVFVQFAQKNLFEIRFVVFQVKHVDGRARGGWRSALTFSVKSKLQTVSDVSEWLWSKVERY
jgi:hypothetical protein